jgi:hypothetical protein
MPIINPPATAGGTDSDPRTIRDFWGKADALIIGSGASGGWRRKN